MADSTHIKGKRVAVIGAGAIGLVATKNLIEEGFEVTTFEKNSYVAGLWHVDQDPSKTSVLEATVSNVSKQGSAYSDWPMPREYPTHPTSKQMEQYIESYAEHFGLMQHIRLGVEIDRIEGGGDKWVLFARSASAGVEVLTFDRLVIATGPNSLAHKPQVRGIEHFRGEILHSQQFKNPSKYQDKRVLVVGLSNSAADCISFLLREGVSKLYVSHRRGFRTIPRIFDGKALDWRLTFRLQIISSWIQWLSPSFSNNMMMSMLTKWQNQNFPELKNHPCMTAPREMPPAGNLIPAVSEDLAHNLISGKAESVQGIAEITDQGNILLTDGTELRDIDLILFCTGLHPDLGSLLPPSCDPYNSALARESFEGLPEHYIRNRRIPRLYRGFISLQHPHSLAFLGSTLSMRGALPLYDLITMALAQIWNGKYPLPSQTDMEAQADSHFNTLKQTLSRGDIAHPNLIRSIEHDKWLHSAAGTGVYHFLGNWWSWGCWKLWWQDRNFYKMLMDGPMSPHISRVFDTDAREPWRGAKEAILQVNEDAEELKSEYARGKMKKS